MTPGDALDQLRQRMAGGLPRWARAAVFLGAFAFVLGLAMAGAAVTGLSSGVPVDPGAGGVTLDAPNGPAVTLTSQTEIAGVLFPASDTVSLGALSVSGGSGTALSVDSQNGTFTRVSLVDVGASNVTLNPNDKPAATLLDDAASFAFSDIALDDGSRDLELDASSPVGVTLRGLPTDSNISVVDSGGRELATGQTDGSGTVTLSLPSGQYDAFVQADDGSGGGGGTTTTTTTTTTTSTEPPALAPTVSLLEPQDGTQVGSSVTVTADVADPSFADGSDTLLVEFFVDGELFNSDTLFSNSTASETITSLSAGEHTVSVRVTDGDGNVATSETRTVTAFPTGELDVVAVGPDDGALVDDENVTLSAEVSDPDFDNPAVSEAVETTFVVNGQPVDNATLTSDGQVTTTLTGLTAGQEIRWYVRATDNQGNRAQTETRTVGIPGTLFIRNESAPSELIAGDVNVTVTGFGSNGSIVERTVTNGRLDLSGFTAGQDYVVQAEAPGYYTRTAVLQNLLTQQSIYLLDESVAAIQTTFTVDDRTGDFESPTVFVRRALNQTGTTQFRTVAAGQTGVSGLTVRLEEQARYRIIVENRDGDKRDLGVYSAPVGQSDSVVLEIGQLSFGSETPDGLALDYARPSDDRVQFNYSDPSDETELLEVVIHQRGDESNILVDETFVGPLGNASVNQQLTALEANQTWVVDWTATIDGQQVSGSSVLGAGRQPGIPIDPIWLNVMSTGVIVLVAGLVGGGVRAELGAVVTALLAAIFWWLGWLPETVGGGVVVLALLVGGLYYAASTEAV